MKKTISTAVLVAFVLVLASCGTSTPEQTTPAVDSCAVSCDTMPCDSICPLIDTIVKK